jgi:hypothetical protein
MNAFKESVRTHISQLNQSEVAYVVQNVGQLLFTKETVALLVKGILIKETSILYGILEVINEFFHNERSTLVNYVFCVAVKQLAHVQVVP